MKVALVHDFLIEYGGAERVLEALHEIWPKAPVYTAFYNPDSLGKNAKRFKNWRIITSWGTKLPFWKKLVSPYRIFAKSFFEKFNFSGFDLVISSSNMYMAKAVTLRRAQGKKFPIHICYCHTPPRFLYGYPTALNWRKHPILRPVGEIMNHFMRVWDFEVSQVPESQRVRESKTKSQGHEGRVDYFIANSCEVQARIKKFYRRESVVIYPPVDVRRFALKSTNAKRLKTKATALDISRSSLDSYFLIVSRLVGAKNVDVAVEACADLNLPLKVIGTGKDLPILKKLAKGSCEFLGEVSDDELINLYKNCRAVIFPAQEEDFGLVPAEAMAAGKPVIVLAQGGVIESVIDQVTGVYFNQSTVDSLEKAIKRFTELEKKGAFDPKVIQKHAQKFAKERFKKEILEFVKKKVK